MLKKLLLATLLLCLASHVYLGFALGLSVDEAHYALYATHPALSYFDHPPLVGWVQIPFAALGGADWMMRMVPLVLWGVTAWALWRGSGWALLLFLLSPVHQLLGLALIPDTLLFPLTLATMYVTWRLWASPHLLPLWLLLGLVLGLAGLSKYTGVFLALGVALVLLPAHGWRLLRLPGFWAAVLLAASLVSPVLIWNAQHDWMSFKYQSAHAQGGGAVWSGRAMLSFAWAQLLAYGALPVIGLCVYLRSMRSLSIHHAKLLHLCVAFALPLGLVLLLLSGQGSVLPHWTACVWLALLPVAALGLQHLWQQKASLWAGKAKQGILVGLAALQAFLLLGLTAAMLTGGLQRMGPQGNPFADLHDWERASQKAGQLMVAQQTQALAVSHWTLASRLAWYARPAPVWALDDKNQQFPLWFGRLAYGARYIWVDWSQKPLQKPVGCSLLDSHLGEHSRFDFYLCTRP